jgi:thioredoxin 1
MIDILEFYSDTCAPCKMIAPMLEQVEKELGIKIDRFNISDEPEVCGEYHISKVPTIIIFDANGEKERIEGVINKSKLMEIIKRYL